MSWVSMFDGGPCTVVVLDADRVTVLWSGILTATNSFSPQFTDSLGNNYLVGVDSSGGVTLSSDAPGGTVSPAIRVYPQFPILASRVAGEMPSWSGIFGVDNGRGGLAENDVGRTALVFAQGLQTPSGTGGVSTPAMVEFPSHVATIGGAFVGVSINTGG